MTQGDDPTKSSVPDLSIAETVPKASSGAPALPDQSDVPVTELGEDSIPGYSQIRAIKEGGQGMVYRGLQSSTGRDVAIKVLKEKFLHDAGARIQFDQEVKILASLRHKNIVNVTESGSIGRQAYFVMDYIPGKNLDQALKDEDHTVTTILNIFEAICDAVSSAHIKGVMHRDLKPNNIRLDEVNEPFVLDFGLAKLAEISPHAETVGSSEKTVAGFFKGTRSWASPEQVDANPDNIDIRTDVYSLGLLLYHMLTGEMPYKVTGSDREVFDQIRYADPKPVRAYRPTIDRDLEAVVHKCLRKSPDERYESAGALLRDMQNYRSGLPVDAKGDSHWYRARKYLRRYRPQIYAGCAAVAAVIVVLLVAVFWVVGEQATTKKALATAEEALEKAEIATLNEKTAKEAAQQLAEDLAKQRVRAEDEARAAREAEDNERAANDALQYTISELEDQVCRAEEAEQEASEAQEQEKIQREEAVSNAKEAADSAEREREASRNLEKEKRELEKTQDELSAKNTQLVRANLEVKAQIRGAQRATQFAEELLFLFVPDSDDVSDQTLATLDTLAQYALLELHDTPLVKAQVLNSLGDKLLLFGKVDQAIRRFQEAVQLAEVNSGTHEREWVRGQAGLCAAYADWGQLEAAQRHCEAAIRTANSILESDSNASLMATLAFSEFLGRQGDLAGQGELLLRVIDDTGRFYGLRSPQSLAVIDRVAKSLYSLTLLPAFPVSIGSFEGVDVPEVLRSVIPHLREYASFSEVTRGEAHPQTLLLKCLLADLIFDDDPLEAATIFDEVVRQSDMSSLASIRFAGYAKAQSIRARFESLFDQYDFFVVLALPGLIGEMLIEFLPYYSKHTSAVSLVSSRAKEASDPRLLQMRLELLSLDIPSQKQLQQAKDMVVQIGKSQGECSQLLVTARTFYAHILSNGNKYGDANSEFMAVIALLRSCGISDGDVLRLWSNARTKYFVRNMGVDEDVAKFFTSRELARAFE